MLRDLDIKLVVLIVIGAVVFGIYTIFPYARLNNTPEEEVFYISPDISDVEPVDLSGDAAPDDVVQTEGADAAGQATTE